MNDLDIRQIREEPQYQASKWQQLQLVVEPSELDALFQQLGDVSLFRLGGIFEAGEEEISSSEFLSRYSTYIDRLKNGELPDKFPWSAAALTIDCQSLYLVQVAGGKQMVGIRRPVIQVQEHFFDYSHDDHKFRSMVYGTECVTWGIQFSYPQLFTDPETSAVCNVLTGSGFPNTALFREIQRWIRKKTVPTPFIVDGQKINSPIRLGKECFSWINRHPGLVKKGIAVDENR